MTAAEAEQLAALRMALNKQMESWNVNSDVEGALWLVRRAIDGRGSATTAIAEAKAVLSTIEARERGPVPLAVRTISAREHAELMGSDAPRSVSREEYERMMREAQSG